MELNKTNLDLSQSLTKKITFNNIDKIYILKNKNNVKRWINTVIENEKKTLEFIEYNFCSDNHLIKINKKYLNHNNYTDIITFDLSDKKSICGDIYISLDRVRENSLQLKCPLSGELLRVIVHGVLHLCGYKDKTLEEASIMRNKENHYLSLLK